MVRAFGANTVRSIDFLSSSLCSRNLGRGMRILYKDVKSCEDEDVHVLWSILVDSHRHPGMVKLKL
ncbi:hypothetical protein ZWY2020_005852 [Hordeum vulgare]|nr:hypothetical protein ZWY2020_005852 [Hordeum vulgare]